jgi:hypothetical protein
MSKVNQIAKWRIKYYKSAGQQFEAISHTIFNGFVSPRNYQSQVESCPKKALTRYVTARE